MIRTRMLLAVAFLLLFSAAAQSAVYNGGRCDGAVTLFGGDYIRFVPGTNPAPRYLWILVQQGGGNVFMQDSSGGATGSMFFNTFDLFLFDPMEWTDLYFQGGSTKIYYGGCILNPPQNPICNTGSLGPVVLLTDELRTVGVQSGYSPAPGIQVTLYQKMVALTNGNMPYKLLSNPGLWATAQSTSCSGSHCCNPQDYTFFIKNATGQAFSAFMLDSEGMAAFDWTMVPAPPILCGATASPTSGTVPVTVAFKAAASGGVGGFTYAWTFGDGKAGEGESVSHTYKAGGTFNWKLTVTDLAGKTCQKASSLTFLSPLSLTAAAMPRQGSAPLTVAFSCEPKGGKDPYTYEWIFGDGESSTSKSPNHTYATVGKFEALVTVTDSLESGAAATVPVYCGVPIDPAITAAQKMTGPFRVVLAGADFEPGCVAFVGGAPVPVTQYKKATKVVLKGSALKAMFPKGESRCITVVNPSGGQSACYWFTR